MPYRDKIKQAAFQHDWYLRHKANHYERSRLWKAAHKDIVKESNRLSRIRCRERKIQMQSQLEEDTFYQRIRENILIGVSTNTLPKEQHDRWWNIFMSRCHKKYFHLLDNDTNN